MIRNDPELADWLWEQRDWSDWARSVALYYDKHGFMTEGQHEAAVRMRISAGENWKVRSLEDSE